MTEQPFMGDRPITPPPELVEQWLNNTRSNDCIGAYPSNYEQLICTQAARWAADQELEACCADILQILAGIFEDKVEDWNHFVQLLRDGRRPPPQERALDALLEERANFASIANFELIKSVLERLLDD